MEVGATFMVYLDEVKVLIAVLYACVFVLLTLRPFIFAFATHPYIEILFCHSRC